MRKKSIRDLPDKEFRGKQVFVRVDFNVPLKDGRITDDTRIRAALPTLRYLLEKDASLVLASHLGRPKGKVVPELSLKPVAQRLSELLGTRVHFAEDPGGPDAQKKAQALRPGEVLLLENLRFDPGEEKNDEAFARRLADLADLYVNDAFASSHRAHASVSAIARFFDLRLAGFLMEKELAFLTQVRDHPTHPFLVILGGAKVKDKIGVIRNLLTKADRFLIGGGMAYTFLKVRGLEIGDSLLDEDHLPEVTKLLQEAPEKFLLPEDHVIAEEVQEGAPSRTAEGAIPAGWKGVDIGPKTVARYREAIRPEGTIFWNGPMGVFEIDAFAQGTVEIARAVRDAARGGATVVTGGGDTIAALHKAGIRDEELTHVSTGGGATLEFLAGKTLPGVEILSEKA